MTQGECERGFSTGSPRSHVTRHPSDSSLSCRSACPSAARAHEARWPALHRITSACGSALHKARRGRWRRVMLATIVHRRYPGEAQRRSLLRGIRRGAADHSLPPRRCVRGRPRRRRSRRVRRRTGSGGIGGRAAGLLSRRQLDRAVQGRRARAGQDRGQLVGVDAGDAHQTIQDFGDTQRRQRRRFVAA